MTCESARTLTPRKNEAAGFLLFSLPIPWVHWLETRTLVSRRETAYLIQPIAQRFPPIVSRAVARWDEWQAWLIRHGVCMRHQEHKVFHLDLVNTLPSRAEGLRLSWADRTVLADASVGVRGWVLPRTAIIDTLGLTDAVVACNPVSHSPSQRVMAHDRHPPQGYVACFQPNVILRDRTVIFRKRRQPLSDEAIMACEARYR